MKKYNFISIVLVLCLLISSMGTLPVFASETSVSGLSYTSDFNDPKWQQGTALSAAQFKTKHDYINTTSSEAIDWCTFTVADGAVTVKRLKTSSPNLNMVLDEAGVVDYGVYVIDYDIKEPTAAMDGMASRVGFNQISGSDTLAYLFGFRKNTTENKMQLIKTDNVYKSGCGNTPGYGVNDGGYANEDGWFRMRVVLSKNEDAGWTADVYNRDYSEETSIISHNIDKAGTIKWFRMYTPDSANSEITVRNISVRHTRAPISRLSYKSDFENSEKWENGKEYSAAEFSTMHEYITVPSTQTSAGTDKLTFKVENGALTVKSKTTTVYSLEMKMDGVSDGVLVIDYDMHEPPKVLDGMVSRVGTPESSGNYLFAFRKNTTENKMQLIKTDHVGTNTYGNVEGNAVVDGGFANEDGWFKLRVVLSKNEGAGWTADVYNRDYSLTKSIISHDIPNASAINWFRMYTSAAEANSEITVKNISVKHTTLFGGFEAHRDGDIVEYDAVIKTDMNDGAVIIVALYQGDKLIDSQTRNLADIEDGKIDFNPFDLEGRNYDNLTAKFMMWDSLEGLTPLATSVEMEVLENTPEDTPAE